MLTESRIANLDIFQHYLPLARNLWGGDFGGDPALRYYQLMNRSDESPPEALETVKRLFDVPGGILDKMSYADIHLQLPALLTMNDRAAAAYGLENRCPFLDHRIVEFAFRLPEDLRIREMRSKWILREVARGLIPDAIVDRADKKGLVTPVGKWLRGPLYDKVNRLIGNDMKKYQEGNLGVFDRKLYHALCLKVWEKVRKLTELPGRME
jgi:asparagine synthetase B (glutamine-hydrolysing)